jgi:hypothetical protein
MGDKPLLSDSMAEARAELIDRMRYDGIISEEAAMQARSRYLDQTCVSVHTRLDCEPCAPVPYSRTLSHVLALMSCANLVKIVAIVILLYGLATMLPLLAAWLQAVPIEVPQTILLVASVLGVVSPKLMWRSQAGYVAILSTFSLYMTVAWVVWSHKALSNPVEAAIKAGRPVGTIISALCMVGFAAVALVHESRILGFFSVVSFSSVLGFGMYYYPGCLTLYILDSHLGVVTLGHTAVVGLHTFIKVKGTWPYFANIFGIGLNYYAPLAMGIGFLCGASPWFTGEFTTLIDPRIGYLLVFLLVWAASMGVYFFCNVKAVGSYCCVFSVFILLEWVAFLSSFAGFVPCMFALGASLYGLALLLERHSNFLVLK